MGERRELNPRMVDSQSTASSIDFWTDFFLRQSTNEVTQASLFFCLYNSSGLLVIDLLIYA
jgi:hypothetical protein